MPDRRQRVVTFDELIDEQWAHIEEVVRALGRRHYLSADQLDQFRGVVHRSLQLNDFELLKSFDGRSTWETYLTTVISRELILFQGTIWQQWRPSRLAQQLGPAAVLLEKLVHSDGLRIRDAIQVMHSVHGVRERRYVLLQIARRLRLKDAPAELASNRADHVDGRYAEALREALKRLTPDERLMVQLRVRDQQPLSRIALMMAVDVARLTHLLERAKMCIADALVEQGMPRELVGTLLHHGEVGPGHPHHKSWCAALSTPAQ
jgi:DNA-directed RNA polymerase specialized sigma24 family protein